MSNAEKEKAIEPYEIITFPRLGDERGALSVIEGHAIGFSIKRVYYIYDTVAGVERGFHAHRACRQLAVAVSGTCTFRMDNGVKRSSVKLDDPRVALRIEPMVWHEMYDFSPDCVILVLASDNYDEKDYIRNYAEFKALLS